MEQPAKNDDVSTGAIHTSTLFHRSTRRSRHGSLLPFPASQVTEVGRVVHRPSTIDHHHHRRRRRRRRHHHHHHGIHPICFFPDMSLWNPILANQKTSRCFFWLSHMWLSSSTVCWLHLTLFLALMVKIENGWFILYMSAGLMIFFAWLVDIKPTPVCFFFVGPGVPGKTQIC